MKQRNNISTVIVEDEKPAARRLKRILEKLGIEQVHQLHSIAEAIDFFKKGFSADLIFLDVQLSDGLSFEIFEKVPEIKSAVIFTTAYDRYALRAFELQSVDYLLKPIAPQKLEKAIQKFEKLQPKYALQPKDIQELKKVLSTKGSGYKKRFSLKIGEHIKIFKTTNIECFTSENKATYLYTEGGKRYLMEESLNDLSGQLNPKIFFRINRRAIVNIEFIRDIIRYSNSRLRVKLQNFDNQKDLIVSRERVQDFKDWLEV